MNFSTDKKSNAGDFNSMSYGLVDLAEKHVHDILQVAIEHSDAQAALVVLDTRSELALVLGEAYRRCLPKAKFIHFDEVTPQTVLDAFETLKPADLVVLIQSTSFRLNAFRVRIELFNRSLKVIEHPHLFRMVGSEAGYYIDSLAYDSEYYRGMGSALKQRIDQAQVGVVDSGGELLLFESRFEHAKLNVGDYSGMKNWGGQFPIGEVFTEAKDLDLVNGRVRIFAFGDNSFRVNLPEKPITLIVTRSKITDVINSTPEFDQVLANIRADEGEVWVRELGLGLNRAFTQDRVVSDIGTFERMCGIHLSLGAKHAIYKKPQFTQKTARHHVDVFVATHTVTFDHHVVFQDGAWQG